LEDANLILLHRCMTSKGFTFFWTPYICDVNTYQSCKCHLCKTSTLVLTLFIQTRFIWSSLQQQLCKRNETGDIHTANKTLEQLLLIVQHK